MADVVNLNRFRKQKQKADAKRQADQNAVKFGRTKAEREREGAIAELTTKRLDELKRDDE
ncbi:DUF4169 family protein [Marivivens donghaensis]|uniref:DUF4169 family protein n=1 Tax=Marivivens donghaensis TaxID=1699413 RepID=A0ABX0VZW0_9RHOB|nr:DUF4169 family protein [Marivivens donghaensis]NIY72796.1 DUF4169 family protein [Marivivens donghaensis]